MDTETHTHIFLLKVAYASFEAVGEFRKHCEKANSVEDSADEEKLRELYSYYSENREALAGYYDRGRTIPPTRERVLFITQGLAVLKAMFLLLYAIV